MVYVTGDTHGDLGEVFYWCCENHTTKDDIVIILGDVGLNYYGGRRDEQQKNLMAHCDVTLFCLQGNHEKRPEHVPGYHLQYFHGGAVFVQDKYPNILFPVDGECFDFDGKKAVVCGGAYSVDKFYRLARGWSWFEDEQPDDARKARTEATLAAMDNRVDYILTHTCPLRHEPVEVFLGGIDQSQVDDSTERWLETVEKHNKFTRWYCGHFHTEKNSEKVTFLFHSFVTLGDKF
jgi:hypothetical protein